MNNMITSIIADNITEYIRRHITQENCTQRFQQGQVFCIRKDGGDIEDIGRINSPQNLYRSWSENNNPCIISPLRFKLCIISPLRLKPCIISPLRLNRVLSTLLGSTVYYQPTQAQPCIISPLRLFYM